MEDGNKYVEISSRALKAEEKVKAAVEQYEEELKSITKDVSKKDMANWISVVEDDNRISGGLLEQMVHSWVDTHPEGVREAVHSLLVAAAIKTLMDI